MAGNTRDRLRAFEAAEAALRYCEGLLTGPIPPPMVAANTVSPTGMYDTPTTAGQEKWQAISWSASDSAEVPGGSALWDKVSQPPRCIAQRFTRVNSDNPSIRAELPQPAAYAYQVTGRGVGANRNTAVLLQSSFIRD